jgi:hypothetical protein
MKVGQGIDFHSFVLDPAIEVLYKTFGKTERYKFNKEKQIVTGPFMIPDLPIYRNDASHGEYYVVFDKQTVVDLNEKFMSEQKTLSFNYQHMDNSKVDGAVLVENWIVGEGDNKAKSLGFDVPVGTWMGSVKINNIDFWNSEIKTGNAKGFSIEGYLDMQMRNQIKNKMNKDKFISAKTKDGVTVQSDAEAFAVGVEVYTANEAGETTPLADGEYTMEDGSSITVSGGKITVLTPMAEEAETESALSVEDIAALMSALSPSIEAAITKALEPVTKELSEVKEKFSKLPGNTSATAKTEDVKKKPATRQDHVMTIMEKLKLSTKK